MPIQSEPMSLFWLPKANGDWNQAMKGAIADDPTGRMLRGVCSVQLGISQLRAVKAAIEAARKAGASFAALRAIRVGLVGAGTLDFVADALPGTAPRFGMMVDVAPVQYNGIASAAFTDPGFEAVDVVVVMPDAETFARPSRLLDKPEHDRAVAEALAQIGRIADAMRARYGCVVVVATIATSPEGVISSSDRSILGSYVRFLSDINAGIHTLAAEQSLVLWDLAEIAAMVGARLWRDPVAMHVAKSLTSISLAPLVADRLCAALAPLFGKSRRGLVVDLDNTLWGGVIGDDGLAGIVIGQGDAVGEAHLSLQRYILELRRRGIVLSVCSKNDDSVAREPFRNHPDMLLREEHFAVFQANWSDKATNIKAIADALTLNLDALVFLDDNPAERARVRQQFPEVAVPELPDDPALYTTFLAAGGYFESATLSADDLVRADAYQGNARREEIRRTIGDYDSYLASLDMTLAMGRFDKIGRARIAQLINKSNQFNLTTRRRQEPEVEAIELSDAHVGLQFRLTDSFGDNGMISVVVLALEDDAVVIDTWLMSCRVLERGVEKAVLNEIVRIAADLGKPLVIGAYIPTPRNQMVRDHYPKLGFVPGHRHAMPEEASSWQLDVAAYTPFPTQIGIDRQAD